MEIAQLLICPLLHQWIIVDIDLHSGIMDIRARSTQSPALLCHTLVRPDHRYTQRIIIHLLRLPTV